jgi:type I restriction enzyme S subunit
VLQAAVEGRLVPTEAQLAQAEGRSYEPASELLKRILLERRRRWEEVHSQIAARTAPRHTRSTTHYVEPTQPLPFGLPLLPEGWLWTTVETIGDVLLGRQRAPQYLTGRFPHPYLRVANIKDDHIDLSDVEVMDFDNKHYEKYRLQDGDILVSEGQSPELVGQSAIYRGEVDGLCFQKTLHRFRAVRDAPSVEFAQMVFRAHVRSGVFRRLASITTNIAHLTLEKFKATPFPLPPAAEQSRILDECKRLLTLADNVEHLAAVGERRSQRLHQSILKWAFEGKLVDEDPNDEPAAVLLERIRAERAAEAQPAPRSRGRVRKARTAAARS